MSIQSSVRENNQAFFYYDDEKMLVTTQQDTKDTLVFENGTPRKLPRQESFVEKLLNLNKD